MRSFAGSFVQTPACYPLRGPAWNASGLTIRLEVRVMAAMLTPPNRLANAVPDYDYSAPSIVVSSSGADRALVQVRKQPFALAKTGNGGRHRPQCQIHDAGNIDRQPRSPGEALLYYLEHPAPPFTDHTAP